MKRSESLRLLSSEHHSALVLARQAGLAVSREETSQAWVEVERRFRVDLEPHFRKEESELLPALLCAGETSLVRRTLEEHAQLRSLAYEGTHDADTLRQLAELLKSHVRFEERELFEVAQLRLPAFSVARSS